MLKLKIWLATMIIVVSLRVTTNDIVLSLTLTSERLTINIIRLKLRSVRHCLTNEITILRLTLTTKIKYKKCSGSQRLFFKLKSINKITVNNNFINRWSTKIWFIFQQIITNVYFWIEFSPNDVIKYESHFRARSTI